MKHRFYLSSFLNEQIKKKIFQKKKYIYITFKILGAKNRRKNLHKHPGPTLQIRPGPGYFSRAALTVVTCFF